MNYEFKNFVCTASDIDANGFLSTGVYKDYSLGSLVIQDYPSYSWDWQTSSFADQLTAAQAQYIAYPPSGYNDDLSIIGVHTDGVKYYMDSGISNYFGLPYQSVKLAYNSSSGVILYPNGNAPVHSGCFYAATAQPIRHTEGYYFGRVADHGGPFPGQSTFSVTNRTSLILAGLGNSVTVAGYAEQTLLNGDRSKYAYLGQYFDAALTVNTNGVVTTNKAGIVDEYGEFFPLITGPAALLTKPDTSQGGLQGTCIVQVVSLSVDLNHDGKMDTTFCGPDTTTQFKRYSFWVNGDYDRLWPDSDDHTNYEDSVTAKQGNFVPDCDYMSGGYRAIPTKRDLEDFARLWINGIDSNLVSKLPPGTTVTLDWGDVGSTNSWNPTIDIFIAVDADGGIAYQTNAFTAALQINSSLNSFVGRLGPGQQIQLYPGPYGVLYWPGNHYIWCGVSNGIGTLCLTICQGGTNTLAQTYVYIQLQDIKQMYERWTVGETPRFAPTNTPGLAFEDLPMDTPRYIHGAPTDANTAYILLVHGWNMERYEKDRFAERAFKRLYWQGYQGRFGFFRWPTGYGFSGWKSVITDPDNFDNSEFNAWRSGRGLLTLLTNLNAEYPGNVYLMAHSMGNVVAGEALRGAGSKQLVNTYVAMQAAVPSHAYDPTATVRTIPFPWDSGTSNRYAIYWQNGMPCYFNGSAGAGTYVNYFNTNDFALSKWQIDQNLKVDMKYTWDSGSGGIERYYYAEGPFNYPQRYFPQDTFELFSYCIEARCYALGAQRNIGGVFQTGSHVELDTSPYAYGPQHLYHSLEFRADGPRNILFWDAMLKTLELKPL